MASSPNSSPSQLKDNKWHSFTEWMRYHVEKLIAIGFWPMLGSLAVVALILILVSAIFLVKEHGQNYHIIAETASGPKQQYEDFWDYTRGDYSFTEAIWQSLMHAIDTGTFTGESSSGFRTVMLLVTLAGVFIMASLISIFSSALERNIAHVRKGRTPVVERNHTLILGWSPAVFNVVNELVKHNKKVGRWHGWKWLTKQNTKQSGKRRIVILAYRDKVEMEDEIRARLDKADGGRWRFFHQIICRTGNPLDTNDLQIVKPYQSHSIVILSPPSPGYAMLPGDWSKDTPS